MISPGTPLPSDDEHIFHVSSDGLLALTVKCDIDGDQLIGFHGYDWNLQASILSEITGLAIAEAIAVFIEDVLNDRSIIAVLDRGGVVQDVWVTNSPKTDLQYLRPGETLTFRYWSGKAVD